MKYFVYKYIIFPLLLLGVFFLYSCSDNTSQPFNTKSEYSNSGVKALVVIVENNDLIGFSNQNMYNLYKSSINPVLASIFGVPVSNIQKLTLLQIIKQYGEPWQIKQISDTAKPFYDRIIILNHKTATMDCLRDSLLSLGGKFTIDLILNIHGSQGTVLFSDKTVGIGDLTGMIKNNSIKIRAVYQTCCYGKYMIDSWNRIGVSAVNGAEGDNILTTFSSCFFIKEWTSGKTFSEAVYAAYYDEIDKLRTYDVILPITSYLLTPGNLYNSMQTVGGINTALLWKQIPL